MTAAELHHHLTNAGAGVTVRLDLDCPAGVLTPSVKAGIHALKPMLVARLALESLESGPPNNLPEDQRTEWFQLRDRLAFMLSAMQHDKEYLAERAAIQAEDQ